MKTFRVASIIAILSIGLATVTYAAENYLPASSKPTSLTQAQVNRLFHAGVQQYSNGQFQTALKTLQAALYNYQILGDRSGESSTLINLGLVHYSLAQYNQALTCYQQALVISQADQLHSNEATAFYNLGLLYANLGQSARALEFYQQALVILREIGDPLGEATTLLNMGYSYDLLGEYAEAENLYQQSLTVANAANDRISQAYALNNLGYSSYRSDQFELALTLLRQALLLFEEIGGQVGEIQTLDSLGQVYVSLEQFDRAWEFYQQALVVATAIGDRASNRLTLSNMGDLLVQQNQPELAIIFYKRSVNITEEIRRDIQGLPIEQQQSYTDTVADTYRKLADLLLQQDRILEAQQVLDLLKVQEIQDYLRRGVRGTEQTGEGVYLLEAEQQVFARFEELLQQGQRLAELQAIPVEELTPEQLEEHQELSQRSTQIQTTFNAFLDRPDVQAALQNLRLNVRQAIDLETINTIRTNLVQSRPDAVFFYPFVLDDRLELIVLSPHLPPLHKTVEVTRVELNQAIVSFLEDLQVTTSDPKPNAAKLYDWLVRPIEPFLAESGANVILYAPDYQLRYIPLAALYDGQQWFVEKYQINQLTAASLTNLSTPPRSQPRILAGAYSEGRYLVPRRSGEDPFPFNGLPFAKVEVQTIARLFPETRQLLDQAFTKAATLPFLNSYNIVHFATHAMFTTGSPEDSFIVMGNGETINLNEIRSLSLPNVDLMVLSGCETAVSNLNLGQDLGDGAEILGFGYQVQNAGARATIASLWSVDDGGTEVLMSQFYALLQQGNLSKAAALQQAQIALIKEEHFQLQDTLIRERNSSNLPSISTQQLTHPYYWAPFILIGNGL